MKIWPKCLHAFVLYLILKNQVLLDMYKLPILWCPFFPPVFEWHSKPTMLDWVLHMGIFILTSQANMTSFFEIENIALTNMYQFIIQNRQHVWTMFHICEPHMVGLILKTPNPHQHSQIKHSNHKHILCNVILLLNEK